MVSESQLLIQGIVRHRRNVVLAVLLGPCAARRRFDNTHNQDTVGLVAVHNTQRSSWCTCAYSTLSGLTMPYTQPGGTGELAQPNLTMRTRIPGCTMNQPILGASKAPKDDESKWVTIFASTTYKAATLYSTTLTRYFEDRVTIILTYKRSIHPETDWYARLLGCVGDAVSLET